MKKRFIYSLVVFAAMACGCSNDSETKKTCATSDDCSADQVCRVGVCVDKSAESNVGDFCNVSNDCSGDMICIGGECRNDEDGSVLNKACGSTDNCIGGLVCVSGKCVKDTENSGSSSSTETQLDTDGDTIPDIWDSCDEDTDGDTIPNCQDTDSDGDTIPDWIEAGNNGDPNVEPIDSLGAGIYDFLNPDTDGNGIPDKIEAGPDPLHPVDTDKDGIPDYRDEDNDGDFLSDLDEITGLTVDGHPGRKCGDTWCEAGTPDNPWDSDGDTIPDYNDPDSDGDGVPDILESLADSDGDGILNLYDTDSDNDTIPDGDEVDAYGNLLSYTDSNNKTRLCFMYADCDGDALADPDEVKCSNVSCVTNPDCDGDGFLDGAEFSAAKYAMEHGMLDGTPVEKLEDIICNAKRGVTGVFDFFFELPYGGTEKRDDLRFEPSVQKLDLVFNVDTTESMSETIANVKGNISNTITSIQNMVDNSGFGLTNFDDVPVGNYGVSAKNDLPFRVLGTVSSDKATVQSYMNNQLFTTRHGNDVAESGVEALYQIATGAGETSWNDGTVSGSIAPRTNAPDTWGGVDFRKDTLPIVIHTTDAYSHDNEFMSYNASVSKPHYSPETIQALQNKGIRVITLSVPNKQNVHEADLYGQMTSWAKESSAVVPACAFAGACGENKCCLGAKTTDAEYIHGKQNQCVLAYQALQKDVSSTIVSGVDALIKYGTYDVATRVIGMPIEGTDKDTSCFIKKVVASAYIPPAQEPERSCNPQAMPTKIGDADYFNGFTNFAPGTSSKTRKGAELHFTVNAQNDACVPGAEESQIFTAYIDVYNPTTGLSFGTREVSIIVPPVVREVIN